jgi:archaeosine-15-forming tRNA-guanine transglycosylase
MANYASKFATSDNVYTGGYTSLEVLGNYNDDSKIGRGVVQIHITTGTVDLQAKLTAAGPWTTIKNYTASTIEEIVIAPYFRVVVSDSAECFYAEHS